MLQADYDTDPGQNFTVEIKAQEDGSFKASSPNAPDLGEISAKTRQEASLKMADLLHSWVTNRYKPKGLRKAY